MIEQVMLNSTMIFGRYFRKFSGCMMCLLILFSGERLISQNQYLDSLLNVLETEKDEFELLRTNTRIGHFFQDNSDAKAIEYYNDALELAIELDIPVRIANSHYNMAYSYLIKSDYDLALDHYLQSSRIYEEIQDSFRLSNALMSVANIYSETLDFEKTEAYHEKAYSVISDLGDPLQLSDLLNSRGVLSDRQGNFEDALNYFQEAYDLAAKAKSDQLISYTLSNMGLTYKHQGKSEKALAIFNQVLEDYEQSDYPPYVFASVHNNIGSTLAQMKQFTKAKASFEISIEYAKKANAPSIIMEGYKKLAELYKNTRDFEKQAIFQQEYYTLKDSLFSIESKNTIVQLEANYQIEQKNSELLKQEAEITKQKSQRNLFLIISSFALLLLLLLGFFYKRIKGTNKLLEEKSSQITQQNEVLENTLSNLKSTQAQLIQSEKMASLGELTSGIAHEIQNPLNFVNNFSEVSVELLDEVVDELSSTPIGERNIAEAKEILEDLKNNLGKITHHGDRASGIVRGMLDHSRTGTGEKVSSNINTLADEYLRLSYHGLRAKDNTFNCSLETDYDSHIDSIKLIPQDIGRVLLNVFSNAFYAVHQRSKNSDNSFISLVRVSTRQINQQLEITISDNGIGMSSETLEKIFQPFFTTKPTGSGTGLGMSISYDIITKGHGGTINAESKEGEGTIFKINLPFE